MPFNIDSFKSNIDSYGYLTSNKFEVYISPPKILFNSSINNIGTPTPVSRIVDGLRFRIEQVRVPGVNLLSSDINAFGVGITQKQPFNAQLADTTFSILVDGYGEMWQFWYNWIRQIVQFNGTESSRVGNANRIANYTVAYKDDYSTIMQIVIYDTFGNAIQRVNLYEAFPTSLREVPLAWGDNSNLMRIAVSVTFSEFTLNGSVTEPAPFPQPSNLSTAAQISRVISQI